MSAAVAIGTLLMVAFCALQAVGLGTEYWMAVGHTTGLIQSHAGLFKLCYEVLSINQCFYYVQYARDFLNVHYLGIVGTSLLGCLLLFIAGLVGLCGCSKPYAKPTVQNLSGVGVAGGFFCSVGVVWYYLYIFKEVFGDVSTVLSVFGVDVSPGYSFYLCAAAGGGSLLISIILMIIGCNMPVSTSAVLPSQQPQTVIAMTNQGMHSGHQPSYPPNVIAMQNSTYADPFAPQPSYNQQHYPKK